MSLVYFTADCHFGHKAITKYRPFETAEEHHEVVMDNILSTATKRDTVWILGDICFNKDELWRVQKIADSVNVLRLVLGNHDLKAEHFTPLEGNVHVYAFTEYKRCWVSHCPIHPQEFRNRRLNIHGHLHGNIVKNLDGTPDRRYCCVSLEHNDYKPISWDQIKEERSEFFT